MIFWAELGFTQRFAGNEAAAVEFIEEKAAHAMPAPYGVRVFYHLSNAYSAAGETKGAMRAIAKMMSARDGLVTWKSGLQTAGRHGLWPGAAL